MGWFKRNKDTQKEVQSDKKPESRLDFYDKLVEEKKILIEEEEKEKQETFEKQMQARYDFARKQRVVLSPEDIRVSQYEIDKDIENKLVNLEKHKRIVELTRLINEMNGEVMALRSEQNRWLRGK